MCVIIFVPKNEVISDEELVNAWTVNPDGAGYAIQKDGKVEFKRGFMDFQNFYNAISPLIGNYNLLLHFRISTSDSVNRVQTHPYKKGNVTLTEGVTERPVICMNGIISGQKEYKNCNDTMSFIIDNKEAFEVVNQNVLNIIEEATGAKWAVMKPDEVLLSSKFVKQDGRYYSNTNHLWTYSYYKSYNKKNRKTFSLNGLIKDRKLRANIRKDDELFEDVNEFIEFWCNGYDNCRYCTKCLNTAKTLRDVKITLKENYYYFDDYYPEIETKNDSLFYDDVYDYKNNDDRCLLDWEEDSFGEEGFLEYINWELFD